MTELSRRKKIVFSLIPLAVLIAILAVTELLLRSFRPADDLSLVREARYDGIEWYETNRSALSVYFPAGTPSIPEFKGSLFRKQKAAGAMRIFCLGESTMFGTPYDMNANIPGILRKQLRRLMPGREVEVINWGASAINSNVVRDLAPALLEFHPDAVLIYLGHNELYGPDGIGASWVERQWPALTRLKYAMRKLRLMRLLQSLLPASAPSREEAANLMKQVSGGNLIGSGSPEVARVCRNFEDNLRSIIATYSGAGIPVIVSDVTSNLLFPPFVTGAPSDSTLKQLFLTGDDDSLMARFRASSTAGEGQAGIHYWAGRALLRRGDAASARKELVLSRDLDMLKFRAPTEFNEVIHRVAEATGASCVPADSLFTAASPQGIPGDELFWEHLHPTLAGYYIMANGYLDRLVPSRRTASPRLIPPDADSLSIAWLELAYADLSIQHLTGRWPFHDYRRDPAVIGSADPVSLRIASAVYGRQATWNEGCYQSATLFWSRREFRKARTTYEAMLEEYPFSFYTNYLLGSLLANSGDRQGAVPYFRRSIASNPDYPNARLELGLLLVNLADFDGAIAMLERLTVTAGGGADRMIVANACYGLGAAYANKGELDRALEVLDRAIALRPGYADAERLSAQIRDAMGR